MKLKRPPNETVQLFHEFMNQHSDNPSKEDIIQFVSVSIPANFPQFTNIFQREFQRECANSKRFSHTLQANFEKRGTEFDDWMPTDWTESPKYLSNVKDDNFREFGMELNKLWKILGRKMKDEVAVREVF